MQPWGPAHRCASSSSFTVIQSHKFSFSSQNTRVLSYLTNAVCGIFTLEYTFPAPHQVASYHFLHVISSKKALLTTLSKVGIAHLRSLFISFTVPIKTWLIFSQFKWLCFMSVSPRSLRAGFIIVFPVPSTVPDTNQTFTIHCVFNCFYIHAQKPRNSDLFQ